jgi:large subunit ribosomal protein L14
MIQLNTKLFAFDNSGIRFVKCIRIFNKNLGSFLLVSVKSLRSKQKIKLKIKKGSVLIACLLKKTVPFTKRSGLKIKTDTNGVVLVNKQLQPMASRVIGVVSFEIKLGMLKTMTLSGTIV